MPRRTSTVEGWRRPNIEGELSQTSLMSTFRSKELNGDCGLTFLGELHLMQDEEEREGGWRLHAKLFGETPFSLANSLGTPR